MRAGGGKSKGSAQERHVCKLFSLWISHGLDEDLFWRSSISGGRATVAHKAGKTNRQAGDICSVSPEGHQLTDLFFVEIKHVKKLQIDKFILFNTGIIAKFWAVCIKQAADHGRLPMLIAKENGIPEIVVTLPHDIYKLCEAGTSFTRNPEIRLLSDMLKAAVKER